MTKARDLANLGAIANSSIPFRNRFINGGFRINQRGSVAATPGGSYGPDRWIGAISGGSAISGNFVSSTFQPSQSGFGAYLSGVSFTNGTPYFAQRIEAMNTADLSGGQVTVSGKIYQDSGSTMNWSVRLVKPNTTDNYGAVTYLTPVSGIMVPSGSVTSFTATFTLGSTDAANGLAVEIYGTSTFTATSKSFAIADMQFEKGAVATPFEFRPIGTELALCQRYFEIVQFTLQSYTPSATAAGFGATFKVTKRSASGLTLTRVADWATGGEAGTIASVLGSESYYVYKNLASAGSYNVGGQFTASSEL